jgi:Fur family transcriptional regulator, ferric uptake regulator
MYADQKGPEGFNDLCRRLPPHQSPSACLLLVKEVAKAFHDHYLFPKWRTSLSSTGRQNGTIVAANAVRRVDNPPRAQHYRSRGPRVEPVPASRDADDGGVELLCIARGLRMTGHRRIIARVLTEADDHPNAEELHHRAVLLDPRVSMATVYRTIRLFEKKGILQRRDFGRERARYEPSEHGPHYHLIDVETGKVLEFKSAAHERLVRSLAKQLGYEVVSLRLEIFGKGTGTITAASA